MLHPLAIGGHFDYANSRGIYTAVNRICAANPGVVLADNNDGHYIRYHSECSVISNNLLMSEISLQKFHDTKRLMGMSFNDFLNEPIEVDYLLVRRMDDVYSDRLTEAAARRVNVGLGEAFLWSEPSDEDAYTIVAEGKIPQAVGGSALFVRFIRLTRPMAVNVVAPDAED